LKNWQLTVKPFPQSYGHIFTDTGETRCPFSEDVRGTGWNETVAGQTLMTTCPNGFKG